MSEHRFLPGLVVSGLSVVLLIGWLCAAGSASGATQTWDIPVSGGYTWVVPDGITTAEFSLAAASGASSGGSQGGNGGRTVATIAVTPGESLRINVGGSDGLAINGGGAPGFGNCSLVTTSYFGCLGGNGGGASDVRQGGTSLENRILVAGGGGGAGGVGNDPSIDCPSGCGVWAGGDGGDGGGLQAFTGAQGAPRPFSPGPGSWLAGCGGVGGALAPSDPPVSSGCWGNRGYSRAGAGSSGGANTSGGGTGSGTGGGGGAGYFGGGGGSSGQGGSGGGGGGGGSSFVTEAATNVTIFGGVNLGDGEVTVTYGGEAPPVTHTLNVTKTGTGFGSVTSSPAGIDCGADCSQAYNDGTQVTLTASPTASSTFTGWSGAGCSGTGTCQVNIASDQTATANFTINPPIQHTLTAARSGTGQGTITSSPAGIDCGADCSQAYNDGTQVTLTASPTASSTFTGWSGAGCSGTGTCQVNIASDQTATANFAADTVLPGKATISKVAVSGPRKVEKGKKATYKVRISNSGSAEATGVRLKVSGRGVSFNTSVGTISAGTTRTVKVKLKPKKPGKVKVTFKAMSENAGGKTVKKTITVKK